jgi:hypothetical protein
MTEVTIRNTRVNSIDQNESGKQHYANIVYLRLNNYIVSKSMLDYNNASSMQLKLIEGGRGNIQLAGNSL